MTFKMSEVFELPVKKTQGGVLPFLKDCNPMSNTIFVGNDNHVDATVIAINAYDDNQQEIAELKQLAETKNARTLERIGRIERQEREISALKNQISQLKYENSSMAAYAERRINMLTRVNNKLREGKS